MAKDDTGGVDHQAVGSEPWTEQKYADALDRLNKLQDQLNILRSTMPNMVSQFSISHETPDELYNAFEQSAYATVAALDQLKIQWKDQETQQLLEHARKSWESNKDFSIAGLSRHHDPDIKDETTANGEA